MRKKYQIISVLNLLLCFVFLTTNTLAQESPIDWNILDASSLEELMPFFETSNVDQFGIAVTLLSRIESEKVPEMLLDAWDKSQNQQLTDNLALLDNPIIRIALAASLQRTGAYNGRRAEFENYIYGQIESSEEQVKSNAILSISSFRDVRAARMLSQIADNQPEFCLDATRGLCNILMNPESDEQSADIAKAKLQAISNGYFSEDANHKEAIKKAASECLDYL